jgi:hypothetical protein
MKMHPLQLEILTLLERLNQDQLSTEDLQRITALSIEMNKLNPRFEIIEFKPDQH